MHYVCMSSAQDGYYAWLPADFTAADGLRQRGTTTDLFFIISEHTTSPFGVKIRTMMEKTVCTRRLDNALMQLITDRIQQDRTEIPAYHDTQADMTYALDNFVNRILETTPKSIYDQRQQPLPWNDHHHKSVGKPKPPPDMPLTTMQWHIHTPIVPLLSTKEAKAADAGRTC